MAAPDDQNIIDLTSEDELLADEEASGADEEVPVDHPMANEGALKADVVEPQNHSATNPVALESPSTTVILLTSSRLGLLSVPPEVRILIYRHLLVEPIPLSTYWIGSYDPIPAILQTSRLIRREAFPVFFEENTFFIGTMHPKLSILNHRQISDTIQNVEFTFWLDDTSPESARGSFIDLIEAFGSPAIARGTLHLIIRVAAYDNHLLPWLNRGLPRFTNFRNVIFRYVPDSAHARAEAMCPKLRRIHTIILQYIFGPGLSSHGIPCCLLFHPLRYLDSLPRKVEVDWMDYLDGVRLTWDQDLSSDVDEPEA